MKSNLLKFTGAAVLAAGMAFVYAETPAEPQHHAANRQEWAQRRFDRMASTLNLTDAQKTQAQAIMKEARESTKQFAPQLKQNRQALAEAVKTGKTADIERLSAEQGQLMGKMMAVHSEAFSKIYQTLTPEQRVKADQMQQHFGRGRHAHKGNVPSKS
jgi:Spy/CpxP family protein refolding chaperone